MTATALLSSAYSSFAARAIGARPELAEFIADWASAPITRERIDARLNALAAVERQAAGAAEAQPLAEEALRRVLRRLRVEVFCAVMERDLAGRADVAEVTATMTDLAEAAIQHALATLAAELEAIIAGTQPEVALFGG